MLWLACVLYMLLRSLPWSDVPSYGKSLIHLSIHSGRSDAEISHPSIHLFIHLSLIWGAQLWISPIHSSIPDLNFTLATTQVAVLFDSSPSATITLQQLWSSISRNKYYWPFVTSFISWGSPLFSLPLISPWKGFWDLTVRAERPLLFKKLTYLVWSSYLQKPDHMHLMAPFTPERSNFRQKAMRFCCVFTTFCCDFVQIKRSPM